MIRIVLTELIQFIYFYIRQAFFDLQDKNQQIVGAIVIGLCPCHDPYEIPARWKFLIYGYFRSGIATIQEIILRVEITILNCKVDGRIGIYIPYIAVAGIFLNA